MNEYRVEKAGGILRYHDLPGRDIPILFIHGLGCSGSSDYPQVAAQEALLRHRRILVDLIGCGYSDKPESFGYTVADHAEYLAEFVAAAGLDSFILFGHSLGGAVALSLADKCRDRVRALILSEANLDKSGEGSTSKFIADCGKDLFLESEFAELVRKSRDDGNERWAAALSQWSPRAAYLISESAAAGTSPSWRQILYFLACPRTFIFGENSLPDPDSQALEAHGVRLEVVERAGHSMAWENPRGLAEAIGRAIAAQ